MLNSKERLLLIVLRITALTAALSGISYVMIASHVTAKNLTKVEEGTSDQVGFAIKDAQRSLSSFAHMVMDHHLDLNFLLAK
jgi:DNA-binding FrmR family transcriptional regulator